MASSHAPMERNVGETWRINNSDNRAKSRLVVVSRRMKSSAGIINVIFPVDWHGRAGGREGVNEARNSRVLSRLRARRRRDENSIYTARKIINDLILAAGQATAAAPGRDVK